MNRVEANEYAELVKKIGLGILPQRTFEAVIFDMDETLVSSGEAIRRSWTRWAIEFGVSGDQLRKCHGIPSDQVVRAVVPADLVERAEARIMELELSDYHDIRPLPGAQRALSELPPERVAIATSCTKALMERRHRQSGLPTPGTMIYRELVSQGKPAPDTFLRAAEALGVDPKETLVVEDSPAGLAAAKAAGAATLAIITTTAIEDLDADGIVNNLEDIAWSVTGDGIRLALRCGTDPIAAGGNPSQV